MNTTRTHTEEIRNEILFLSNAHQVGRCDNTLITYDIGSEGADVTAITFVKESPTDKKFIVMATVVDSELSKSIEDMNERTNAVITWEKSFYCRGCRNKGRENFMYLNSTAHGEEHRCDNCASTIFTSHQPTRKQ